MKKKKIIDPHQLKVWLRHCVSLIDSIIDLHISKYLGPHEYFFYHSIIFKIMFSMPFLFDIYLGIENIYFMSKKKYIYFFTIWVPCNIFLAGAILFGGSFI